MFVAGKFPFSHLRNNLSVGRKVSVRELRASPFSSQRVGSLSVPTGDSRQEGRLNKRQIPFLLLHHHTSLPAVAWAWVWMFDRLPDPWYLRENTQRAFAPGPHVTSRVFLSALLSGRVPRYSCCALCWKCDVRTSDLHIPRMGSAWRGGEAVCC